MSNNINYQDLLNQKEQEIKELKYLLNEKSQYIELQNYLLTTLNDFKTKYENQINIHQMEFNNIKNNLYQDLINENKKLKEENDNLLKINTQIQQNNIELNNDINELIKLEEEYEQYKINQKNLLISNNKLINDIHKKEMIKINKVFHKLIDENKKLIHKNNQYKIKLNELLNNTQSDNKILLEWINKHTDIEYIRKCDIPNIQLNNISIITIINQARIYYNYDVIDKMSYKELKDYLKINFKDNI